MFNISKSEIEAVCPSGMRPDDTLATELRAFFGGAAMELAGLCTDPILASVADLCDLDAVAETKEERLCQAARRFVIAQGFYNAVPHLDLVLTPTGFGVVSNQNVAPASADRVERLRVQMKRQAMAAYEDALTVLREFDEWHASPQGILARRLFWHSRFLAKFGETDPTLETLRLYTPKLSKAEAVIRHLVSDAQFRLLIQEEATAGKDSTLLTAIDLCRNLAASLDDPREAVLHRDILLRFLDDNIDHFAAYRASSAYAANHFQHYENKREDPCFFFG